MTDMRLWIKAIAIMLGLIVIELGCLCVLGRYDYFTTPKGPIRMDRWTGQPQTMFVDPRPDRFFFRTLKPSTMVIDSTLEKDTTGVTVPLTGGVTGHRP
jgi:hypothetical protein